MKKIVEFLRTLKEDFKAWRRGEVRVAPGTRGRVYARKATVLSRVPAGPMKARSKATANLTMTITRKDGRVETITVPAEVVHG